MSTPWPVPFHASRAACVGPRGGGPRGAILSCVSPARDATLTSYGAVRAVSNAGSDRSSGVTVMAGRNGPGQSRVAFRKRSEPVRVRSIRKGRVRSGFSGKTKDVIIYGRKFPSIHPSKTFQSNK